MVDRSLDAWLALLLERHGSKIELGLTRVKQVLDALEISFTVPIITVAGTNGKGSVCAMLDAVYRAAGYRVGLYTSPHLLRYNERVRIAGEDVSDATLAAAFARVEEARGDIPLTYFEHGTLAAVVCFAASKPDVVILEVGLGGRLDAVNVLDCDCAVITGVAIDHTDFLGSDREQIGFEKAGIMRLGKPAVCADPLPPQSLLDHAQACGAELYCLGRDFGFSGDRQQWAYYFGDSVHRGGLAFPALRGVNQLQNAAAVMTVLQLLRNVLPVAMQAIRQGFMLVEWPGRFQILPGRPTVVLDVAHNVQAIGVLAENLANMGFYPNTWAVFGALGDKDILGMLRLLKGRIDKWMLAELTGPRAKPASTIANMLLAEGVAAESIMVFDSPQQAYGKARQLMSVDDRMVVCGSFLTVADVMAVLTLADAG